MSGTVVHDDQMFTRHLLQFTDDRVPLQVSPLPESFDLNASGCGRKPQNDHRNTNDRNRARQSTTNRPSPPSKQAQMPNALYEDEIKQSESRCEIMIQRPGFDQHAHRHHCREEQREPHLAIPKKKGKGEERQRKHGPNVKGPEHAEFMPESARKAKERPAILKVTQFPADVKIFHLDMMVDRL